MKRAMLTFLMGAALVVGGGLYVSAQEPPEMDQFGPMGAGPERMEQMRERRLTMMSALLDLTEEQKGQIEALLTAEQEKHQALRQQMHQGRQGLRELMQADEVDEAQIRKAVMSAAEKRADLMVAKARTRSQIFALLTPEQQEKAQAFWDAMGPRHGRKGMGKGMGRW